MLHDNCYWSISSSALANVPLHVYCTSDVKQTLINRMFTHCDKLRFLRTASIKLGMHIYVTLSLSHSETIFQAWKLMENNIGHGKSWKMIVKSWNFYNYLQIIKRLTLL